MGIRGAPQPKPTPAPRSKLPSIANKEVVKTIESLIKSVIKVADKFINKVDNGRARSIETYSDLKELREQALSLQKKLNEQ